MGSYVNDQGVKCPVAIKKINALDFTADPKYRESLLNQLIREATVLKSVKSANVVEFKDCFRTESSFYFVLEYCEGGDLKNYLLKN